ncbi:putative auxin efflux carrier component 5a [Curcuma longa]|uniref:putative auxin efflux carrier component 5a n=1 Tax=Curcuma longa TaxID=136217 RepID=UPI003D9EA5D2
MLNLGDLYKVAKAMVPLYVWLGFGYAFVRWWRITSQQCKAIERLVFFIILPLFTFHLTMRTDPFAMNYRMIGADAMSKVLVAALLMAWPRCRRWPGHRDQERPGSCWAITSFSLTQLTNSLVVGVPLVTAMYGPRAQEVVVQLSVVQAILWLPLLQFVFELRKAGCSSFFPAAEAQSQVASSIEAPPPPPSREVVGGAGDGAAARSSSCSLIKVVLLKLAKNPNSYAGIVGMTWALLAKRWHFETPSIIEDSIQPVSVAGRWMSMFSLGLFMASQGKIFSCGPRLTAYAMALKFIGGPAAMAIGAFLVGLRGEDLNLAIIQAAVPQSITSFIFAQEYDLDADVLSTAVTFGMLVSLPVLVIYSMILN